MADDAKILVIDDNRDIVESLQLILESKGYKVVHALSGEEGLKRVGEEEPNLVILDLMMETKDAGFEVARKLKGDQNHKNIPIIMLTGVKGETGFGFEKEAGDEGWLPVDAYCEKPIKPEELINKVAELL